MKDTALNSAGPMLILSLVPLLSFQRLEWLWPQQLLSWRPLAHPFRCPSPSTTFYIFFKMVGSKLKERQLLRNHTWIIKPTHHFPILFSWSQSSRKLKRLSDWMTFPALGHAAVCISMLLVALEKTYFSNCSHPVFGIHLKAEDHH